MSSAKCQQLCSGLNVLSQTLFSRQTKDIQLNIVLSSMVKRQFSMFWIHTWHLRVENSHCSNQLYRFYRYICTILRRNEKHEIKFEIMEQDKCRNRLIWNANISIEYRSICWNLNILNGLAQFVNAALVMCVNLKTFKLYSAITRWFYTPVWFYLLKIHICEWFLVLACVLSHIHVHLYLCT